MSDNNQQKNTFNRNDVEILSQKSLYKGFFKANSYRFKHRLFAGGWSAEIEREVFERGHAAAVLLYDLPRDKLVLVEQFRFGALETCDNPWLLEMVAGIIEPGEAPDEVVRREAVEEAGVTPGRMMPMLSYLASPGGSTERLELFLAEVDSSQASGLHGLADEGEDIRVQVISRSGAMKLLQQGVINNAATVIALQWLALNFDQVTAEWGS
ncbi:ADP-ribose diphosphatase [Motilimonas sp. E26]|uniref:ADP-ribose diphosphatase n=1 Tax=Motilimonas sp. E26 TaxID=2865674 RepID=UPI001E4859A7|nr:ADP-ribose diphosphatase [Motilimonas sp. E26]MCE0557856.1 ADP-ribose diphosphatase [Motilimonas sp. E26]